MKRHIFLLIALITSFTATSQVKHWKNKVYYVPPAEELKQYGGEDYVMFAKPLKVGDIWLTNQGYILLESGGKLHLYDATLTKKGDVDFKGFWSFNGFRILGISPNNDYVIVGMQEEDKLIYHFYRITLPDLRKEEILVLKDTLYPGYAPVPRLREQAKTPSGKKDLEFLIAGNVFEPGTIRNDTLFIWARFDPLILFGQLVAIPVKDPKYIRLSNRLSKFFGYDRHTLAYGILLDTAASVMSSYLILRKGGKEYKSPRVNTSGIGIYRAGKYYHETDHQVWVYHFPQTEPQIIEFPGGDGALLAVSESGNRIAGTFIQNKKRRFGIYDMRTGKWTVPDFFLLKHRKPRVDFTYDGESFVLATSDTVYIGYLNDDSRPALWIHAPDTVHASPLNVKIYGHDRAFVSGLKEIRYEGKAVKSGETITVKLKKGENTVAAEAADRAGNKKAVRKKIVFLPE